MTDTATDAARTFVKSSVTPDRWNHTRGVLRLSGRLAETYGLDSDPLRTAALFHDNARDLPTERQRELAERHRGSLDEVEEASPGLWHAPAGARRMIEEFDYTPSDTVTRAVGYHTTGRPEASNCLSALFVADFAEPNRDYPEAETIRSTIGEKPLDHLVKEVLSQKIHWIMDTDRRVHPRSIQFWNQLCD